MQIRPATPADADALAALVNGAYRGPAAAAGWTHEAELLDGQRTDADALRDAMARGVTILLASPEAGGALLGCVSMEPKGPGEKPDTWTVGMLTVDPGSQGGGLGSDLLLAAEAHARERGATRFEMTVIDVRDSLIAWYGRRGYRPTGATAPFPYGNERFGRPRRPDLVFAVLAKQAGS